MTNPDRDDVDDLLDQLSGALNVEPSSEFEARVRECVATETVPSTRWYRWWWMGAAAVAATAIVVMMVMPHSDAMDEVTPVRTARVEPTKAVTPKPVEVAPQVERTAANEPTRAGSRAAMTPAAILRPAPVRKARSLLDAPVIVPPGQEEALRRLAMAVNAGKVTSIHRVDDALKKIDIGELQVPAFIQLSAIRIDPIYEGF